MDKQTRNKLIYVLGGVTIVVLAIFLAINYLWPKHNWEETYVNDNKEPYGGYLCEQLLKNYYPGKEYKVLKDNWDSTSVISDTTKHNTNYVFVGSDCYIDSSEARTLAGYVARGNNAMLVTPMLPYALLNKLGISVCNSNVALPDNYYDSDEEYTEPTDSAVRAQDSIAAIPDDSATITNESSKVDTNEAEYDYDRYVNYAKETFLRTPSVTLNFTHPKLQSIQGYSYHYIYDKDTPTHYWHYIVPDQECASYKFKYAELGTIGNEHINFIRVKYGKGYFLLHTTPLAFSNYYLLKQDHLEYAEKAFSHLTDGSIYWDQYSQNEHYNKDTPHRKYRGEDEPSPLRYILSQPSLRWAWYLVLAMIVLYSIFQLKRRQRMIPVLEPNTNTSMEFAQTVSRLYFQQNDHRSLAIQQMRLFLAFIRSRYHINTSLAEKELQVRIVAKSGISEDNIALLFARFQNIQNMPDINEKILIEFHQSLENFYHQCK